MNKVYLIVKKTRLIMPDSAWSEKVLGRLALNCHSIEYLSEGHFDSTQDLNLARVRLALKCLSRKGILIQLSSQIDQVRGLCKDANLTLLILGPDQDQRVSCEVCPKMFISDPLSEPEKKSVYLLLQF